MAVYIWSEEQPEQQPEWTKAASLRKVRTALVIALDVDGGKRVPARRPGIQAMHVHSTAAAAAPASPFLYMVHRPAVSLSAPFVLFLASLRSYNSTTTGNLLSARPCSGRFSFPQEGNHASSPTHRRARHQTLETPQARARRSGRRHGDDHPSGGWLCRMWMAGRSGELDSVRQLARKMDRKKQQKKSPEALGETTLTCRKKKETASHCQPLSYSQHRSLPQCVPKSVLDPREACSQTARLLCRPAKRTGRDCKFASIRHSRPAERTGELSAPENMPNNAVSAKWLDMEYLFIYLGF
jgi:hypothetical protein